MSSRSRRSPAAAMANAASATSPDSSVGHRQKESALSRVRRSTVTASAGISPADKPSVAAHFAREIFLARNTVYPARSSTTSATYCRSHGSGSECDLSTSMKSESPHDSAACTAASRISTLSAAKPSRSIDTRHEVVPTCWWRARQRRVEAAKLGCAASVQKPRIHPRNVLCSAERNASPMISSAGCSRPSSTGSISKLARSLAASRSRPPLLTTFTDVTAILFPPYPAMPMEQRVPALGARPYHS